MDASVVEEKQSFKMLDLNFSSNLDWGSFAKTAPKKIVALVRFLKFFSPEVALYLYKSTKGHAWNSVVMSGLVSAPSCFL